MSLAATLLVGLLACRGAVPPEPDPAVEEPPMTETAPLSEAERHVRALNNRTPKKLADKAKAWIVAHPDEAHPVLLTVLAERGPEAKRILDVLPKVAREGDAEAVAAVLDADQELLAFPAARCLAELATPRADQALVAALDGGEHTRRAALDGLRMRAQPDHCDAVGPLVSHEDSATAERAQRAMDAMGCAG